MPRFPALLALMLAAPVAFAEPFPNADPKAGGRIMAEKNCNRCHIAMFGGDGTKIFTRPDRKVKSASALLTQVQVCNTNLSTSLFPEEEEDVAAFLNQKYYKFK